MTAPNKWLERTMLADTSLAGKRASAAPHRPPLSHTVGRTGRGADVRVVVLGMLLLCCITSEMVWAGGGPLSVGLGGGLDASAYSGESVFDFGPVLGGFVAWEGSYPRVYRLSAQWTRLRHETFDFCNELDFGGGDSRCDDVEIVHFTSVQGSVLWFDRGSGLVAKYFGGSIGVFRTRSDEQRDSVTWSMVVSPVLGARFRLWDSAISIESGAELVIGHEATFAIIPVRLYVEL